MATLVIGWSLCLVRPPRKADGRLCDLLIGGYVNSFLWYADGEEKISVNLRINQSIFQEI